MPTELAATETQQSRRELEATLGVPVTTFAYPHGRYDKNVVEAVAEAGFELACTDRPGRNLPATHPLQLHRYTVTGTDPFLRFALMLWLGDTRAPLRLPRPRPRSRR